MSGPFVGQLGTPAKISAAEGERKPLTVLQMVDGRILGEAEYTARTLSAASVDARGRALIAAGGEMGPRVRVVGAETFHFQPETSILNRRGNIDKLISIVDEAGVDVIHAHSPDMARTARIAADALGAKLVVTVHEPPRKGLLSGGSELGGADRIITMSDYMAGRLTGKSLSLGDIAIIPPGADMNVFAEEVVGPVRTIQLADDWGLTEDTRPILMAPGRLGPDAGHDVLIQALARLKKARGEDFLCLIIGEGDPGSVEAAAVKAGLSGAIKLVGKTDDPAAAMKLAALVVSAAMTPPPAGREIIEAQAMGRPVVAPAHGAAAEIVQNGVSGWLTPPGDADALAAALGQALDMDESQRAHIGMAGRAQIRARYTLEAAMTATLAIYEDLAGRTFQSPNV